MFQAIGRNWLFAGSKEGGQAAAVFSGFIASCKHYDLNPYSYLEDVLNKLSPEEQCDLQELLPGRWKAPKV